jgi:hypothetical protein
MDSRELSETLARMRRLLRSTEEKPSAAKHPRATHKYLVDRQAAQERELVQLHEKMADYVRVSDDSAIRKWGEEFIRTPIEQADRIAQMLETFPMPEMKTDVSPVDIRIPKRLPYEIKGEVEADVAELRKCLEAGCYRSCVILCGRLLEVVLHRKYFDKTQQDALEKSPGIGLGNLIAKMREKGIAFEPGVTQQIHLVNQVRIFSVHKKEETFRPSESQTKAIVLFTMDLMEKFYG